MAVQYNPGIVTDGLVLYLDAANIKSYPTSGNTAYDLSFIDNQINLINGVSFDNNVKSFNFDGVNDYINCNNNDALRLNSAFTITIAFNATVFDKTWQALITKGDSSFRIHRFSSSNPVKLAFGTSGLSLEDSETNNVINTNQNYIVTCVYTGSQKIIYINGVPDRTDNVTGSLTQDSIYNLAIGENLQATGRYFNGKIYCVQIYNKGLNSSEVLQNFNALRGRFGI
jgi:hypothetical protein